MDHVHDHHDPLLTIADVMERLNVGERFVRRLVAERRIGYLKVGAKVRFTHEDLEAFVSSSRQCRVTHTRWEEYEEPADVLEFLDRQDT